MHHDTVGTIRRSLAETDSDDPAPRTYVTKHGTKATSLRVAIRDLLNPELKTQGRPVNPDNVRLKDADYGNSESYTIRRLKRDNPELARRAMEAKELQSHGGDRRSQYDQLDNYQLGVSEKGGTDPDYLTARIARDCPEVHEAMHSTSRSDQTGNKPEMAIGTLRAKRR